ncbi:DHHC palmitoyltransferase-domain-containing protein [Phycomyces blakesleeanus]|uniref:Palmitoyltransferase n=1 Tax=Phycomyces blakesleeanus TaxID=4837 RepID=A0ABR3AVH8_PHYBL
METADFLIVHHSQIIDSCPFLPFGLLGSSFAMANAGISMSSRLGATCAGIILPIVTLGLLIYTWYIYVFRVCVSLLLKNLSHSVAEAVVFIVIASLLWFFSLFSYLRVLFSQPGQPVNKRPSSPRETPPLEDTKTPLRLPIYYYSPSLYDPETLQARISDNRTPTQFPIVSISYADGNQRYCDVCHCIKPDRSHHCKDCNACILKMDHHCPWVSGCVGLGNYKFFYLFVVYTCLYSLWVAVTATPLVVDAVNHKGLGLDAQWVVLLFIAFMFGLVLLGFSFVHTTYILNNKTTIEHLSSRKQDVRVDFDGSGMNFEVVDVHHRELLYDIGKLNNWKIVMGKSPLGWPVPLYRGAREGYTFPFGPNAYKKVVGLAETQRKARIAALEAPRVEPLNMETMSGPSN